MILLEVLQLITHKERQVKVTRVTLDHKDFFSTYLRWESPKTNTQQQDTQCICLGISTASAVLAKRSPKYLNFLSESARCMKKADRTRKLHNTLRNVPRSPLSLCFIEDYNFIEEAPSSCQRLLNLPSCGFRSPKSHPLLLSGAPEELQSWSLYLSPRQLPSSLPLPVVSCHPSSRGRVSYLASLDSVQALMTCMTNRK